MSNGGVTIGAENKVVLVSRQGPGTLDYATSLRAALLNWVPGNVVEPLLIMNDRGEVGSGLTDVKVNDTCIEYTSILRGNKSPDKNSIAMKDVVSSLTKIKKSPIVNQAGVFAKVVLIEAVDEEQIKVILEQSDQTFIRGMTSVPGLIQPEAAFGQIATTPIGSGPYVIAEYAQNSRIALKTDPNCSGKEPTIEEVEVRTINDGATTLSALKSGGADGMSFTQNDMWE